MTNNHTDFVLIILCFKTAFLNFIDSRSRGENSRITLINYNLMFISNYVMSYPKKFYFEQILII
jgi:hypothetical protein